MAERYTPTGACAGCPYRSHCHEARQHVVDLSGLGLGRHTSCDFYREFEWRARGGQLRPGLRDRIGALLRGAEDRRRRP